MFWKNLKNSNSYAESCFIRSKKMQPWGPFPLSKNHPLRTQQSSTFIFGCLHRLAVRTHMYTQALEYTPCIQHVWKQKQSMCWNGICLRCNPSSVIKHFLLGTAVTHINRTIPQRNYSMNNQNTHQHV